MDALIQIDLQGHISHAYTYIYMLTPPLGPTLQCSKIPKFQKNPINFLEIPIVSSLLEFWNFGISKKLTGFFLEFWNFGVLEFWNFRILEFWNFGILEFWNFGILEFWNFRILEIRNFGILELWNFGISQNLTGEFWNFRILRFLQAIFLFIHLTLTNNKKPL